MFGFWDSHTCGPLPGTTPFPLKVSSLTYDDNHCCLVFCPPPPPCRNSAIDRLVTKKLIVYAYLQIGVIQAAAGFYTWLVVMNDYGFPPHILIGLGRGDYFGSQPLMYDFDSVESIHEFNPSCVGYFT